MTREPCQVSVVEAAYLRAATEAAWLHEIVTAALPLISDGLGAMACIYYGATGPLRAGPYAAIDLAVPPAMFTETLERQEPAFVDRTWRSLSFGTCSETVKLSTLAKPMVDAGVQDILNINAYDPSGIGVWLGAPLRKERTRRPNEAETWTRVAAHLGSAFRLRRRGTLAPAPDQATAVLETTGRIAHACSGAAADRLRDTLHDAVVRMERARGPMRRRDPDGAVKTWRTLVDAELTLLDHFERGGKRYIVAVANPPSTSAPGLASLPARERQVAVAAATGRSNKLIGYELGLADSTVRVLLARSARRLGARSRRELVAIIRAHTGRQ